MYRRRSSHYKQARTRHADTPNDTTHAHVLTRVHARTQTRHHRSRSLRHGTQSRTTARTAHVRTRGAHSGGHEFKERHARHRYTATTFEEIILSRGDTNVSHLGSAAASSRNRVANSSTPHSKLFALVACRGTARFRSTRTWERWLARSLCIKCPFTFTYLQ